MCNVKDYMQLALPSAGNEDILRLVNLGNQIMRIAQLGLECPLQALMRFVDFVWSRGGLEPKKIQRLSVDIFWRPVALPVPLSRRSGAASWGNLPCSAARSRYVLNTATDCRTKSGSSSTIRQ